MVMYQAFKDDLRIVYSNIIRFLKFIKLRDTDGYHLLQTRDFVLIELIFNKYALKKKFDDLVEPGTTFICDSFRVYNPAYFEEIIMEFNVEPRVTNNFRKRFLVDNESVYQVMEMYCKNDHLKQFLGTDLSLLKEKQFSDLFKICLKNDSFKIALEIYL